MSPEDCLLGMGWSWDTHVGKRSSNMQCPFPTHLNIVSCGRITYPPQVWRNQGRARWFWPRKCNFRLIVSLFHSVPILFSSHKLYPCSSKGHSTTLRKTDLIHVLNAEAVSQWFPTHKLIYYHLIFWDSQKKHYLEQFTLTDRCHCKSMGWPYGPFNKWCGKQIQNKIKDEFHTKCVTAWKCVWGLTYNVE